MVQQIGRQHEQRLHAWFRHMHIHADHGAGQAYRDGYQSGGKGAVGCRLGVCGGK